MMKIKNRGFQGIYVAYIALSLISYLFLQLIVVNIGSMYKWDSLTINIVCGIGNGILLYVIFYNSLQKQFALQTGVKKEMFVWKKVYLWVIPAGACGCLFLNNVVNLTGLNQVITTYEDVAERLYTGHVVLLTIQMVLLASVVEELLFRGIIYRAAVQIGGTVFAAVLSAFLFAFLHGNLLQGIYAFVQGLMLAYIYERYKSLMAVILFHMASNVISVIGTLTTCFDFMYESMAIMIMITVMAGIVLVISLGMVPNGYVRRGIEKNKFTDI